MIKQGQRNSREKTKNWTCKRKSYKLQHEFKRDIMEDIQDIIDNISGEQESISEWLKEIITKIKKRNNLIKTADSSGGGWETYESMKRNKLGVIQTTVRKYDNQKQKHWKNQNHSLLNPLLPTEPTTWASVLEWGLQARLLSHNSFNENFPNTSSSCIPNVETLANLGNFGAKYRQRTTPSDVENKDNGDGHAQKETSHTTEDKIKDKYTHISFSETLPEYYEGVQKTGEYEESNNYISVNVNLEKYLILRKCNKSKQNNVQHS